MEQTQETTPAAPAAQPAADTAPAATPQAPQPAADSTPANPFKAQIEQARKEWESIGKTKEPEQPPPPHKEDKAPAADDAAKKKLLDVKDSAIKKAKGEISKLLAKMQELEKQHKDAIDKKDEMTAKIVSSKYDDLKTELAEREFDQEMAEQRNRFAAEAEKEGNVSNMEQFLEHADFYIPVLSQNPAIGEIMRAAKYPYASMELLFAEMASKGWKPETLVNAPLPTLKHWLSEIASEATAIVEKKSAPESAPAKPVPPSIVATTSSDQGSEPALKADGASMEDVIRHMRKHGGKGIS